MGQDRESSVSTHRWVLELLLHSRSQSKPRYEWPREVQSIGVIQPAYDRHILTDGCNDHCCHVDTKWLCVSPTILPGLLSDLSR